MARNHQHPHDSSDGSPSRKKKPTKVKHPKTDLSVFLNYPIGSMDEPAFAQLCEQIRALLGARNDFEERAVEMILWSFKQLRRAEKAIALGVKGAETFYKHEVESFRGGQRTFDLFRKLIEADPDRPKPLVPLPPAPTEAFPPASKPGPSRKFPPLKHFWKAPETTPTPEPAPAPPPEPAPAPVPEPVFEDDDTAFDEVDEIEAAAEDWRARIAMVPAVDPRWPVLDQFDLRVDDVLTLRDRGTPEDEILERHPGLTFMDLAACYSCEAEGYRGPLEPPYPADITLVDDGAESD